MAQVSEVMTRGVRSMAPDESILTAAQAMKELKVGVIPVCEGQTLVGLVTDRDIVVRAVAENCALDTTPLSQVMTRDTLACRENDSVENVAREMRQAQVRRLPVVDEDQHLVGMVSLGDLATETKEVDAGEVLQDLSEPSEPDRSRQSAASGAAGGGSTSGKRRRGIHRE
jgi:CBS domain-containing protein